MTETYQHRISQVIKHLSRVNYPHSHGLDDSQISNLEAELQQEIPASCKVLLHTLGWEVEDALVDRVVIQKTSPISEIVFNGFFPALQWSDLTASCQNDLEWFKELDADDKIVVEGAVKPEIYNENRIFFSYGNGLYWFVDLDPGEGGVIGQIVMMYPMYQDNYLKVYAPDMLSFIELIVSLSVKNKQ